MTYGFMKSMLQCINLYYSHNYLPQNQRNEQIRTRMPVPEFVGHEMAPSLTSSFRDNTPSITSRTFASQSASLRQPAGRPGKNFPRWMYIHIFRDPHP